MAIYRCKMCGSTWDINKNESVATCQYCGTQQTLPKLYNDRRINLYDRANHFLCNDEFDKAMGIYEQILNEDSTDAEAYWCLVLCLYGIEYVEDPASHKRVPTVNRTQFTSIFDDNNYKLALQYADSVQCRIYEEEAKVINEIQKGILEISQKEEPFDVFICYRENDDKGRRTPDSILAQELYDQLRQEGIRTFFARITLEDKLGSAYEPYIFAALNSARVMVVLGTRPEFFNAVWVKNEWSRYLALIKNGADKILIPAYKDMDPGYLPEEFSHLQEQDMSRLGFMKDLIRDIKKIVNEDKSKEAVVKKSVETADNANINPLLKRVFMFLEDGYFDSAKEYCERVLDVDPECAEAYLGKLMAEMHVRRQDDLKDFAVPFDGSITYQKAMRFADEPLRASLQGYIDHIKVRNERTRIEETYTQGKSAMYIACSSYDYIEAANLLKSIGEYKDAVSLAEKCLENAEEIRAEREQQKIIDREKAERKEKRNKKIAFITTPIVFAVIIFLIVLNIVIIPKSKYDDAVILLEEKNYSEAYKAFSALGGYKDSVEKVEDIIIEWKEEKRKTKEEDIESIKEKLKATKVGGYITFGSYEQDNNSSNGREDIEWLLLDVKDDKALIISKYALDCRPYHVCFDDITWRSCSLREWLNHKFFRSAFTSAEKSTISDSSVPAHKNPDYDTDPGDDTEDKVFLLSVAETMEYFGSDSERQCEPTAYAKAIANKKADIFHDLTEEASPNYYWWLRSPGINQWYAACVHNNGDISKKNLSVDREIAFVRPALWIDLNADLSD